MIEKVVCWACGEEEVEQCKGCERSYCQSCQLFHDCPALLELKEVGGWLVPPEFVKAAAEEGWAIPLPTPEEQEAAMELAQAEDIFFMDALLKVRGSS